MVHIGCLVVVLLVGCMQVDAQTTLTVYDGTTGTLASGWMDYSWATHSLTSTDTANAGDTYVFFSFFFI
jgi:hypothetical protein